MHPDQQRGTSYDWAYAYGGAGGGPPSLPPGQGGELPPGLEKKDDLPPGQGGVNPGRGRERRSERAQERAQDVYKNPTLTGEKPGRGGPSGGAQGATGAEVQGQRAFTGELPGEFLYFYHPDHLGSTSYVTDDKGAIYEHLQYFPFGETWVQEGQPSNRIPYLFSSKEMDEETKLYYFGARYYDPRTSIWVSADPAFGKFLPNLRDRIRAKRQRRTFRPEQELPGLGGVYNAKNLGVYSFAQQNPVKLVDPDGNVVNLAIILTDLVIIASTEIAKAITISILIDVLTGPGGGDPPPEDKQKQFNDALKKISTDAVIEDFVRSSEPDKETGKLIQVRRKGGFAAANKFFDKFVKVHGLEVKSNPEGTVRSAKLPGEGSISVRPFSSGDDPTVQIDRPGEKTIKARFDE